MAATLSLYLKLLTPAGRRRQFFLILLAMLSGAVELVSIGLVIPFIAVAANALPFGAAQKLTGGMLALLNSWGIPPGENTFALGILFLAGVTLANIYLCFYQYYAAWFIATQRHELITRIIESFCWRPLEWLEARNSADLCKIVQVDSERISMIVVAVSQIATVAARLLMVGLFLVLTQPRLALGMGIPLALSYWAIFRFLQKPLAAAGTTANQDSQAQSKQAIEILGAARELRSAALEQIFYQRFWELSKRSMRPVIFRGIPGHFTRAGLEIVTVLVVVILLVYFHMKDGNLANGLPLLSAYAVAGVRLLPAIQQSLYLLFEIRYYAPSLVETMNCLENYTPPNHRENLIPLGLNQEIELRNVHYAYPGSHSTLEAISLSIPKNTRVAFVGPTGAGKSTLVDLLLGLRQPKSGELLVDKRVITPDNVAAWRRTVGYVPQAIYLLDATIAQNIAFGQNVSESDASKIREAATIANIASFIETLPDGYETLVGERGVRLSGGQCQRIGIARAVYSDPEVVIFDEATSSLDSVTETAVLEALDQLKDSKTLIVIAHRLNTVWDFDQIILLDQGKIIARGTSSELMSSCPQFAELAKKKFEPANLTLESLPHAPATSRPQ